MEGLCLKSPINGVTPAIALDVRANASHVPQKAGPSPRFSFKIPLQTPWPGGGGTKKTSITNNNNRCNEMDVNDVVLIENREDIERGTVAQSENNWVLKILQIRSLSKEDGHRKRTDGERENGHAGGVYNNGVNDEEEKEDKCDACRVNYSDDEEPTIEFNKDTFSRLLKKVSLAEAKIYAQLSYLGNLAYCIPKIKERNLLKYRGLRYVISSIDKRGLSMKTEVSCEDQEAEREISKEGIEVEKQKSNAHRISAAAAYQVAASAASYLHSQTKSILPFKSSKCEAGENSTGKSNENDRMNSEVASLMATTDSVTAVVAAKEEVKQAVADDLNSSLSSPCEWFICDDEQGTRYVVIQGSESLASWQANLLFEPVKFEGLDVLVHRGIYEAAKGIYKQILPEVRAHLKSCRRHVTFRFTGHSLGGSLSTLINLMLLLRKEVPASSLLPVITFGAPSVMCGGDYLLRELGLPRSHVQAITLHRDIVPRAFSCNYPDHVAELLKALNRNFRNHPCLNYQKLLYAPIGELLILQPDEELSPHHDLLPAGSGLYYLSCPVSNTNDAEKLLKVAQSVFLNTPHPLEILSDRSAYGSEGAILRDHDMGSYLKSVRRVIRQELIRIRKSKRDHRRKSWWSLLVVRGIDGGEVLIERHVGRVLQTGRESLERFGKLLASQKHMHFLVVLLFPARLFLLGAYRAIVHH